MKREVVFTPEAKQQLQELYGWIASSASPVVADRYLSGVINTCEGLESFSYRGIARDDIRPGLRVTHHQGRSAIAFTVLPERVEVLAFFTAAAITRTF